MMLKFGRIAVVSTTVLALAAATIPSSAQADGYFPRGYGNGYRGGGYFWAADWLLNHGQTPTRTKVRVRNWPDSGWQVDARLGRSLGHELEAFVAAENLLDARLVVARTPVASVAPPRTLRGGVRVRVGRQP